MCSLLHGELLFKGRAEQRRIKQQERQQIRKEEQGEAGRDKPA
jgi:hypothetical protein